MLHIAVLWTVFIHTFFNPGLNAAPARMGLSGADGFAETVMQNWSRMEPSALDSSLSAHLGLGTGERLIWWEVLCTESGSD